ncbi:ABC transporter substrate-binding protein [bacterium]|nr:MAG: ABC transporter substrate-binding protein [bacterium]
MLEQIFGRFRGEISSIKAQKRSLIACCVLAFFVAAVLGGALLSLQGCSKKGAKQTRIVIWEQKDPEEQALMQKHIDVFMAQHPWIKVTTVHFETDQLHSQFQTAALAGGGPQIVYGPSDKIGPYSVMKLIKPLESIFGPSFFAAFDEHSVPKLGGHIYAVPDQVGNHLMLLYNKRLVSNAPTDTEEWIAMCRKETKDFNGDGLPDRYGLVFNFMEPFWLVPFLGGYGGWVMDANNNPTLDTEAMVKALKFLAALRNRWHVIPKESNYELSDTIFKQGHAAFLINGPWSVRAYIKAGIELGVTSIPKIKETGLYPTPMVSSKGYSISVNVADKDLAIVKELVTYLTSEEVQRDMMNTLYILPSRKKLYEEAERSGNEILKGSLEQVRHGRPMPVVPEMRAIWDAIRPFYQSVLGGQMTPEEAAKKMQKRAVEKIREMKE